MLLVRTYVSTSEIHGLGVFADEFIPSGTLIWKFVPSFAVLMGHQEIEKLPAHTREFVYKYSFPHLVLGNGYRVLEVDNGKFMNHSYTPNTDFRDFEMGLSIVDIHRGDEITANYHEFDPQFGGEFLGLPQFQDRVARATHM